MTDLWRRLMRRKLVEWAPAYIASELLQGIDIVARRSAWPEIEKLLILAFSLQEKSCPRYVCQ